MLNSDFREFVLTYFISWITFIMYYFTTGENWIIALVHALFFILCYHIIKMYIEEYVQVWIYWVVIIMIYELMLLFFQFLVDNKYERYYEKNWIYFLFFFITRICLIIICGFGLIFICLLILVMIFNILF
jgi:hypothetical protein